MKIHDQISFTREYCRCRRIPYRFINESLIIDNCTICYSIFNIPYVEIVKMIDDSVNYKLYITVQRTEYHGTNQLVAVICNIIILI